MGPVTFLDMRAMCWQLQLLQYMKSDLNEKCYEIGSLDFMPWSKMFEQLRRVYGVDAPAPALNANGGGHREIKIVEVYAL